MLKPLQNLHAFGCSSASLKYELQSDRIAYFRYQDLGMCVCVFAVLLSVLRCVFKVSGMRGGPVRRPAPH